jgi:hypothetical protein
VRYRKESVRYRKECEWAATGNEPAGDYPPFQFISGRLLSMVVCVARALLGGGTNAERLGSAYEAKAPVSLKRSGSS